MFPKERGGHIAQEKKLPDTDFAGAGRRPGEEIIVSRKKKKGTPCLSKGEALWKLPDRRAKKRKGSFLKKGLHNFKISIKEEWHSRRD